MKAGLIVAAALAAGVSAVPQRVRPTSTRPGDGGIPDGIAAPIQNRDPQIWVSIGRPTQSVTVFPNDPPDRG